MNGISRLTIMIIQTNEVIVDVGGPVDGKYIGWIIHTAAKHCRPILDTGPHFESRERALLIMQRLVDRIRAVDGLAPDAELASKVFDGLEDFSPQKAGASS